MHNPGIFQNKTPAPSEQGTGAKKDQASDLKGFYSPKVTPLATHVMNRSTNLRAGACAVIAAIQMQPEIVALVALLACHGGAQ